MKRYKLLKDLPTFKGGDKFFISNNGNLCLEDEPYVVAYSKSTLKAFPNILTEWFEKIPEQPKTVWDLNIENDVYYYTDRSGDIYCVSWADDIADNNRRDIGNCFLTREEALKELARRKAKQILLRDTKGFNHFNDGIHYGWGVYYDLSARRLRAFGSNEGFDRVDLWFETMEDAEASIKAHEKEWKIYLGVEG